MFAHWFNYDESRGSTFNSWHTPSEGDQLASDGFFYMGNSKNVVCCGCFKEVQVDIASSARREHEKKYPSCKLFRVIHMIEGVPTSITYGTHGLDQEVQKAWNQYTLRKSYTQRLDTFTGWTHPIITAEDAAYHGFIYSGIGEDIECTYCRVRINHIDSSDLKELHETLSSHCKFTRTYDAEDSFIF